MENQARSTRTDRIWPQALQFTLGLGQGGHGDMLWRCDALRAGRLYTRTLFATRAEADAFVLRMQHAEPDQMFNVESIKVASVWN